MGEEGIVELKAIQPQRKRKSGTERIKIDRR